MPMPVDYIKVNDFTNINKIIDSFADQIWIEPKEPSQDEISCMFIITIPKHSCHTNLAPIVLLKAKVVNCQLIMWLSIHLFTQFQ